MSSKKIQSTRNYRLFERHTSENRPLDIKKHRKLHDSMKRYGFLESFPIVCHRNGDNHLIVKDGQHRLLIAETLSLPVHWVEEKVDFDVAVINCAAKIWGLRDYAQKFVANGHKAYQEGLDFSEDHGVPIGTAFALLAGTTSFGNCQNQFVDGTFKVRDRSWADAVAGIYAPLSLMAPALKNNRFVEACMAVCRIKDFDPKRLLANAERCREMLVSYSTRDAYLDMMETIYNFHRKQLVGLKTLAVMAMRERNVGRLKAKAKTTESAA